MKQKFTYSRTIYLTIAAIILLLSATINVSAKSSFSGERLKEACLDYIYETVGNDAEVVIYKNVENLAFEENGVTAKCLADKNSLHGNTFIAIEFTRDDRLLRRIEIPVRIKLYKQALAAKRNISRGSMIGSEDLMFIKKDVTSYKDSDLPLQENVIGSKARQNIPEGSLITRASLEEAPAVSRGDKIPLLVKSGAIKILSMCEALQDAEVGKNILVRREGTSIKLQGTVEPDGTVVIEAR